MGIFDIFREEELFGTHTPLYYKIGDVHKDYRINKIKHCNYGGSSTVYGIKLTKDEKIDILWKLKNERI